MKRVLSAMVCWLCLMATAGAGDYAVKYAMDLKDQQEVGAVDHCVFGTHCDIKLDRLDVTICIWVDGLDDRSTSVGLRSNSYRPGCCDFSGGDYRKRIKANEPRHQLRIYEGGPRRGNEYVLNQPVGTLSLIIANVKAEVRCQSGSASGACAE